MRLGLCILLFFSLGLVAQDTNDSGNASFYHDSFQGQETSNGENYNKNDFTAAHRTLPFNTILLVTNKQNSKTVIVRINDRGPFKKSRVIDLSQSAAKKINMVPFGVVPVRIKVLNYLDNLPVYDSLISNGDVWDCYGNKCDLVKTSVYIWQTENIKHAFYMASNLSIENKIDSLVIKVKDAPQKKRCYCLVATNLENKNKAGDLVSALRKQGFTRCQVIK